jgi:hypothetical protein
MDGFSPEQAWCFSFIPLADGLRQPLPSALAAGQAEAHEAVLFELPDKNGAPGKMFSEFGKLFGFQRAEQGRARQFAERRE